MNLKARSTRTAAALIAGIAVASVALVGCSTPGASAPSTSADAPQPDAFDAATVKKLDAIIEDAVTTQKLPGAIVAVWSPEGDYVTAAGYADVDKKTTLTTDVNHRIGSVTKTFTVTALLRLVDAGDASLDDPISTYVDGVPEGDRITLRHLAGMRSGLADYSQNEEWQMSLLEDPRQPVTPQSLLDVVKDEPLHFEPCSQVEYVNTNTILIGLAIEKITGQPLADVVKTEVTDPLGMDHTFLPTGNEFPSPHAEGYTNQTLDGAATTATDWNPSWGWAAGAMISTLDDLKIWVPALAKGELLSPEIQKERLDVTPMAPGAEDAGYGLGIFKINGWIGHNGSLPGYKTVTIYLPEKEMTLVVMVNSDIEDEKSNLVSALMTPLTELLTPDNVYS
ncbi:serine hydrolase [Microbacterium sp. OVT16B]|uniref:serine hydrolase domain-containing protein n=1 Tax=Microbacterium sp. OVT16B TaxID=2862682 RepID=UPI001CBF74D5|nr:serine hydrolase [Microbacterium sp. OVT16B]